MKWVHQLLCHLRGIPTSISPGSSGSCWPVVNPLLLSGCPWAPHQELPYWSLGMASSHNMAPHILPQPLERLFPDSWKVGCVCDSRLERSGTQEPSWTQHVLSLHTKSCWNSTFPVIYSFFPVEFRQRKCPEALDVCLFLLFWCWSCLFVLTGHY